MREMSFLGLKICSYQANLFERSLTLGCSSAVFIRRFMNSKLAKRMDNIAFAFDSTDIVDALIEVENQYGVSEYGKEKYSVEELHWIGYIYRYWSYISEKSSKQIYRLIKPEQLRKIYFPYHSFDPLQAIERISESLLHEPLSKIGDINQGVIAMRKVRNRKRA